MALTVLLLTFTYVALVVLLNTPSAVAMVVLSVVSSFVAVASIISANHSGADILLSNSQSLVVPETLCQGPNIVALVEPKTLRYTWWRY